MGDRTGIEWCDATWNPIRGCTRVSQGCVNCYAERFASRFIGPGEPYEGLAERTAKGPRWTGKIRYVEEAIDLPLRWKRPRRIFVNSMSDLAHEHVGRAMFRNIWLTMHEAVEKRGHTFLVLTKRPKRLRQLLGPSGIGWYATEKRVSHPEPGIWIGISAENQETFDERWPYLEDMPAAVRFISYEPALGWLCLNGARPDWVIAGGESGPGARPMHPAWARSIRDQCQAAGVPFFFKQWGEWRPGFRTSTGWYFYPSPVAGGAEDGVGTIYTPNNPDYDWGDGYVCIRAGKKSAGRILEEREWNEFPMMTDQQKAQR